MNEQPISQLEAEKRIEVKTIIGIAYYSGKRKPHRSYFERGGKTTYVGYFATENEAWNKARERAAIKPPAEREGVAVI